jgi:hypothetical protein
MVWYLRQDSDPTVYGAHPKTNSCCKIECFDENLGKFPITYII